MTFWLSAPAGDHDRWCPVGVEVARRAPRPAARPSSSPRPTTWTSSPREMQHIGSIPTGGDLAQPHRRHRLSPFSCFSPPAACPDDVLLIGLSAAVLAAPSACASTATSRASASIPTGPPLRLGGVRRGRRGSTCEVDRDTTGGLNRRRRGRAARARRRTSMSLEHQLRAGWLRARVTTPEEDQPFYSSLAADPRARGLHHRRDHRGRAGRGGRGRGHRVCPKACPGSASRWPARRSSRRVSRSSWKCRTRKRAGRSGRRCRTSPRAGPTTATSSSTRSAGEVLLGPAVRMPDGELLQLRRGARQGFRAAAPPLPHRRRAPGQRGPAARSVCAGPRSLTWPGWRTATPATGGVDGEDIEEAKIRGPIVMRTLGRAVTAEDYEQLAKEAAPEAARVRAVPAATDEDAGGVRVLAGAGRRRRRGRAAVVRDSSFRRQKHSRNVASFLDSRRTIGARVIVEPPAYQGVTVVAMLRARPWADPGRLQRTATDALVRLPAPHQRGDGGDRMGVRAAGPHG